MSERVTNRWALWAPTIIAVLGPLVTLWVGHEINRVEHAQLRAEDVAIRTEVMPMEKRMSIWMPRTESDAKFISLEREIAELKSMMRDQGNKIDLLTRQSLR